MGSGLPAGFNMNTKERKEIALKFFSLLAEPKKARRLFSADCKHHNPFTVAGMDALLASITEVQKKNPFPAGARFDIEHVIAEREMVAVHTSLGPDRPGKPGGIRQVHLFRFSGDKIVEYWDITQKLPRKSPNKDGGA